LKQRHCAARLPHAAGRDTQKTQHGIETCDDTGERARAGVETLRKPSTGLKRIHGLRMRVSGWGRDTQKTQHGIETRLRGRGDTRGLVETLRKPSTGLKQRGSEVTDLVQVVETLRKPSTGLKPRRAGPDLTGRLRRDTQKTQHGIETVQAS